MEFFLVHHHRQCLRLLRDYDLLGEPAESVGWSCARPVAGRMFQVHQQAMLAGVRYGSRIAVTLGASLTAS